MQSQVRFNRVPEKVPVKVWEALVQSQVRFNRVPGKVLEKVWEALVQGQGSGEGSREGRGGFGAKPGQVQQGSGTGSREGLGSLWCRARSSSTGFRRRFRRRSEAVVQSGQVQLGTEPGQIQKGSGEGSGEGSGKGFGAEPGQVQQDLRPFN